MEKKIHILTPEGKILLEEELKELTDVKKAVLMANVEEMRARGDLSENDGYALALEDYESNEARISEIQQILENSKVQKKKSDGKVGLGETVTVMLDGSKIEYQIVGANEADPLNNKITPESPIGKAIVGKKEGDKVKVNLPKGEVDCEIVKVH